MNADIEGQANVEPGEEVDTGGSEVSSIGDLLQLSRDLDERAAAAEPDDDPDSDDDADGANDDSPVQDDDDPDEADPDEDSDEEDSDEEEGSDEDDEPESGERDSAYFSKKINKQVYLRKAAEERAAAVERECDELRAQLLEAKQVDPVDSARAAGIDPAFAMGPRELAEERSRVENLYRELRIAAADPNGYDEGDTHYTPQDITRHMLNVEQRLKVLDSAAGVAAQRVATEAELKKRFPEFSDPVSELAVIANNARARVPGLAVLPNANELIAEMVVGSKVLKALGDVEGSVMKRVDDLVKRLSGGGKVVGKGAVRRSAKAKVSPAVTPKAKPKVSPDARPAYDAARVKEAGSVSALIEESSKLL